MDLLSVSGIKKQNAGKLILADIIFTQQRLQKIAIAGETGSSKSTLLKIIAGLIQPDEGQVLFEQQRVAGPEEKLLPGHPAIAYLSQYFELRNNYKVTEVLEMANKMSIEEAQTIFKVCRINHLLNRRTDELSGGEKQRIAMARLLIGKPQLLLLDEPFSNMDLVHKKIVKAMVDDISETLKITCILVSHDPLDTLSWADEILVMKDGKIIQQGTPKKIYNQPVDEYTAGLFGNYNLISPAIAQAFNSPSNLKKNGNKILIRPENFKIVNEETNALKGIVKRILFFGSYYELEVLCREDLITIRTNECEVETGDTVNVYISPENVWYI